MVHVAIRPRQPAFYASFGPFTGSDIIWPDPLASTPVRLVRRSHAKVLTRGRGAKSLARLETAEKCLVKKPTWLYFVHRESPHIHTFTHKSHTKTPHLTTSHFTSTYPNIYKPKNINFHFQTDHGNITSPDKKNRQQKSVLRPLTYLHIVTYSSLATGQITPSPRRLSNVIHFFFLKLFPLPPTFITSLGIKMDLFLFFIHVL
jgi:hypothetical protein